MIAGSSRDTGPYTFPTSPFLCPFLAKHPACVVQRRFIAQLVDSFAIIAPTATVLISSPIAK